MRFGLEGLGGARFIFIFVLCVSRMTPLFMLLFALFVPLCFELERGVAWDRELGVVRPGGGAGEPRVFCFELSSDPGF